MSRTVYQLVDGGEVYCQVPTTVVTLKTNRTYDVKGRIRSERHSKTGDLHYVAEFYVVVDHYTKIVPVTIKQVLGSRGPAKDRKPLSAEAKIAASFDARVPAIVWLIPNHSGAAPSPRGLSLKYGKRRLICREMPTPAPRRAYRDTVLSRLATVMVRPVMMGCLLWL
jgi:hypothetical protein